jgi:hypothetical protein
MHHGLSDLRCKNKPFLLYDKMLKILQIKGLVDSYLVSEIVVQVASVQFYEWMIS